MFDFRDQILVSRNIGMKLVSDEVRFIGITERY
jgi:hypothetical protein